MRDHIAALQEQVNDLYASLNELRGRTDLAFSAPIDPSFSQDGSSRSLSLSVSRTLPPLISPKRATPKALPQFHGPTSTVYGLDVAKSSLQTMGITHNVPDDGMASRDRSRPVSPVPMVLQAHPTKDPLWLIDHAEVMRLCRVYEEEIGIMYPVVDIDKVLKQANFLYKFIGASLRTGLGQPTLPGADTFDDEETTVLKMILAITLTVEGHGRSDLGQRFFDAAKPATDLKLVSALDIKSVVLTVLTVTMSFSLVHRSLANFSLCRPPSTFRETKKHKPGASSASLRECASRWACTGRIRSSNPLQMRQNINRRSGFSGQFMPSTAAGVLAPGCLSHSRIRTWIPAFPNQWVSNHVQPVLC